MIKLISGTFYQISTSWVAMIGLAIFILFSVTILPAQSRQAEEYTAGAGSPDLSLYYMPDDLNRWAEAYGETGRQEYIRSHFTFDVAWPLVYTFFLITSISWLYGYAFAPESWQRLANLSPLLAMLFDFLENIATSLWMGLYPDSPPLLAILAPYFTLLKWIFVVESILLLVMGIGAAIVKRVRS